MGGTNETTCPPAKSSVTSRSLSKGAAIRSHEVTLRGEVDFHDDKAGFKCAVDSAAFFTAYNRWRPKMSEDMTMVGNDGSGGHASVTFLPYVDDKGEMQVSMVVAMAKMGKTVTDLDTLAHYS